MKELSKFTDFKTTAETVTAVAGVYIGLSFSFGFLIWNIYLQRLGFYPDALFQARYVLTGTLFIFCTILVLPFLLKNKNNKVSVIRRFILWFIFFTFFIFPFLPAWLGGSLPKMVSIISTEEYISYLNKFGIKNGSGSSIQTQNLCVVYEDNNSIITVLEDRILSLNKDRLYGLGSLASSDGYVYQFDCAISINLRLFNFAKAV